MVPVSQLISPLSPQHHPNAPLCELLLQSKVTGPIPHVIKKFWFCIDVWALLAQIFKSQLYRLLPIPSLSRDTHFWSVEVLMSFWHSLG